MNKRQKGALLIMAVLVLSAGGLSYLHAECGKCYTEVTGCYSRSVGDCVLSTKKVTELLKWNKCTSDGATPAQKCTNAANEVACTECDVYEQSGCTGQKMGTYADEIDGADTSKSDKC